MFYDYESACEATVTRRAALEEIEDHGHDWSSFTAECGDRPTYLGRVVLDWLGY
jgi:hypothetical protein